MEFLIGTETRDEHLSFEVAHAARKMVEEVMAVKAGENVVISADTSSDGVEIEREGVYVELSLVEICGRLGVA